MITPEPEPAASAERTSIDTTAGLTRLAPSSGSGSSTWSAMPMTSSSAYTGGPAIQNGDCGSRHGSTAASGFHQGEPGPGRDGLSRSPGAGANGPVPAKAWLSSAGTGWRAEVCRGGNRSPGAGAKTAPEPAGAPKVSRSVGETGGR